MNILICGASSDVGCAFIKYLDNKTPGDNINVYAHYNNGLAKIEAIKSQVSNLNIIPVHGDLSVDGRLENVNECPDYILYLPAHSFDYMRIKQLDMDKIKKEMQISVYSFLEICKEYLPAMKKKEKAGILTMLTSFVIDEMPPRFMTDYIVIKYALLGATKSLKAEYGSDKLRIDYIAPEMMDTHFLDNIDPRIKEINAASNKSGRLLKPEEICQEMYEKLFL